MFKKGLTPWNKGLTGEKSHSFGKEFTTERRKKISEALKGKKCPWAKNNPQTYKKGEHPKTEWKKGHIPVAPFPKGHIPWNKGKPFMAKEKHPLWKGGISLDPYPDDWTNDLKESIRKRDHYICQLCGIHQDELEGRFQKLDIHHIDYDKDNLNPRNLISLCRSCHIKTNFDRDYWINYFK